MNGLSPQYIQDMLVPYVPRKNLRSVNKSNLVVPKSSLMSCGDRAFSIAAPRYWNDLPLDLKTSSTVEIFKQKLKTYLFYKAFSNFLS